VRKLKLALNSKEQTVAGNRKSFQVFEKHEAITGSARMALSRNHLMETAEKWSKQYINSR
jgi:hypothetical protein